MAIPMSNYPEFDRLIHDLWNKTPLFGLMLHDSRASHQPIADFLGENGRWLDELAMNSGIYILFPLKPDAGSFTNPSAAIAKRFGLAANRLPGIILLATSENPADLPSNQFLYVPLDGVDFSDFKEMENVLADLFAVVHDAIGQSRGDSELLDQVRRNLSLHRRKNRGRSLAKHLRSGAKIVLIKIPEKLLSAFAEGFGKALGSSVAPS